MKNVYDFKLAEKIIRLNHCQSIKINPQFVPFQVNENKPDCVITFREQSELNFYYDSPLYSNMSYSVYRESGYIRQYIEGREGNRPYAIGKIDFDGKNEIVEYLPEYSYAFSEYQNSFSHIALDELMIHQERMILHASFVNTQFGGILFSGPSGIGKSTQASLWEKEGSEIINGDRPFVGKKEGIWYAWGSPYAGSSGYHIAKGFPIRVIVVLKQGKETKIQRLKVSEAFKSLFSEVTINSWNSWYVSRVVDLLYELTSNVCVYQLTCRPDSTAVKVLKEKLIREELE